MKTKLIETAKFVGTLIIIAAMMFAVFAVYADAVGHPLKIWCL